MPLIFKKGKQIMWQKMLQIGSGGSTPTGREYLYDNGNKLSFPWQSIITTNCSASDDGNKLNVSISQNGNYYAFIYTSQKVNFSGYSTLRFDATYSTTGQEIWVNILPTLSSDGATIHTQAIERVRVENRMINLSTLQGEYYIYIGCWWCPPTTCSIDKIWLDK